MTQESGRPEDVLPGNFVRIDITDTGIGMDGETRRRVFEPFFTTQQMGKGAGMGLASSYGIIRHHGGFITLESAIGKGSTFSIFLPAYAPAETAAKDLPSPAAGDETVLLVDDEDMIIDIGKQMLQNIGYKVLTARSGMEAIGIYQRYGEQVRLVILDMVMPHMSGAETLKRLKEINGNIKVIVSSGYDLVPDKPILPGSEQPRFIQKPFNLTRLSQLVREVLSAGG